MFTYSRQQNINVFIRKRYSNDPLYNVYDLNVTKEIGRTELDEFNFAKRRPRRVIRDAIQRSRKYYGKFHKKVEDEEAKCGNEERGRTRGKRRNRIVQENEKGEAGNEENEISEVLSEWNVQVAE